MADPYIDPQETQSYGPFACEQMIAVVKGLVPECDGAVAFGVATQKKADAVMKSALDAHPARPPAAGGEDAVAEARDAIVRFGSHLGSLKGRPVDASVFFGRDVPSVFARRRLVKLVKALEDFGTKIEENKSQLRDWKAWAAEFADLHTRVAAFEKNQRAARADAIDLGPELAAARLAWLEVYTANKALIAGVLRHAGKHALLPIVFDDLAEVHHVTGVSDADPPPDGAAAASNPAANATTATKS